MKKSQASTIAKASKAPVKVFPQMKRDMTEKQIDLKELIKDYESEDGHNGFCWNSKLIDRIANECATERRDSFLDESLLLSYKWSDSVAYKDYGVVARMKHTLQGDRQHQYTIDEVFVVQEGGVAGNVLEEDIQRRGRYSRRRRYSRRYSKNKNKKILKEIFKKEVFKKKIFKKEVLKKEIFKKKIFKKMLRRAKMLRRTISTYRTKNYKSF